MAQISNLSDAKIRGKIAPGRYNDGSGLLLFVGKTGSKSWVFRYRVNGREREMGLGGYPAISLTEARAKAALCRTMRANKLDPIEVKAAEAKRLEEEKARAVTFKAACEAYIAAHETGWRNDKHRQQWNNTLATYAYPILGDRPVADIDTDCEIARNSDPLRGDFRVQKRPL